MRARMPSAHLARAHLARAPLARAVLAALACAALTACGGSDVPPEVVVTVTASPSPSGAASASPSTASPTKKAAAPKSEVKGRDFDFGLVVSSTKVGDTDVLVLDRWTDPRVDDEDLADDGLVPERWDLGSDRYVNQNTEVTFDIPVREGASFLLHHCVAKGEPLQSRSVGARELADAPEADRLVLVELDDDGWATGGETFAGC